MTNAVTPMYVATASGMPLLVLGGSAYAGTLGVGGFQEADQLSFASPGCKWTGQVDDTARIGEWLRLALGRAQHGRPGAVYLDFPGQHVSRRLEESHALLWASTPEVTRPHPDPAAIERAAEMLASAERPLVVVGKGAGWADAGDALQRLVGLDIPYVASPMGRGVIPDDDPHFVNAARSAALKGADAILVVGARLNWIFGYGRQPRYAEGVRIAQIDVGGWLDHLSAECEKNEAGLAMVTSLDSVPINPYRLVKEVRDAIGRDANVSVDGETIMGVCRTVLPSYLPRSRFNAGTTGCMGTGVPYAIGAALACPDRPSVAVVGDYAFGAAAMAVETAARVGARVVFVVANNEGIAGHLIQDHMLPPGSPRIASLLPAHYEKIAEMVDALALRVETPDELRPALDRALASEGVSVVHVRVDPKATRVSGSNYLQ
jgi:2-hydroxyacyl-CoA lyase 1